MFDIGTKIPTVPGLALMIVPAQPKAGETAEDYAKRLQAERRVLLLVSWN